MFLLNTTNSDDLKRLKSLGGRKKVGPNLVVLIQAKLRVSSTPQDSLLQKFRAGFANLISAVLLPTLQLFSLV